uniref:Uncharacterized protein n=1 Tax=Anguilla anguilla TaxID=7936 RepID=A0A0E9RMW1_ANGAN
MQILRDTAVTVVISP